MSEFNAKLSHHANINAGVAAFIAVCDDAAMSAALGLDKSSRVFVIGTEGATDAELYQQLLAS
jgi:diaminopropionate ammonia-lyase